MENNSWSDEAKKPNILRRTIIFLGLALCVLLYFLEYTYGTKHGDQIGSLIYAFPFSSLLTTSLLTFIQRRDEKLQETAPWFRQQHILMGLLYLSVAIVFFATLLNSLLNNSLPDMVGFLIVGLGILLILFVCVQLVRIRRSKQV